MTRTSSSLRAQLIKLFRQIPAEDVQDQVELFTIYVRAGMTSLSLDIRTDAFEILRWLLETAGSEVVACPGGWTKILKCFVAVFAWDKRSNNAFQFTRATTIGHAASGDKSMARFLQIFGQFLDHGVGTPKAPDQSILQSVFPLWNTNQHLLPRRSNCFAYLNLFGPSYDEESDICEDRPDRQRVLESYKQTLDHGLTSAQKQGGELGRVAVQVRQIWQDGMDDYQGDA